MRRSSDPRSSPSTYSIERKYSPSISPRSYTRQTFGMRHLARDADLVAKAFERLLVVRDGFRQELERDRLVEDEVVGAVDLAHPAFAEHGDDAVAAAEQFARSEPSLRASAGVPAEDGPAVARRTGRRRLAATVRVATRPCRRRTMGKAAGVGDLAAAGGAMGHQR